MNDFWTRRKSAVQAEESAREASLAQADAQARDAALAERPDAELLAEAGMPEPEQLIDSAQVREFLQSALPQRLKTRAMRRLWRLNPVLANLDGLVDYDADFTDAALAVKDLKTSYQVGRGMLKAIEWRATAEAKLGAADEAVVEDEVRVQARDAIEMPQAPAPALAEPEVGPAPAFEPGTSAAEPAFEQAHEHIAPTARRMAFSFERGPT